MLRGLFVNNKQAKDSIFESGYMVYQSLKLSENYQIDYCEVDIENREISRNYDFFFFNYHPVTMGWLETKYLKNDLGFVITMILEIEPDDAFVMCPKNDFNLYCALDPTIKSKNNLYSFPRPLEKFDFPSVYNNSEVPVIGSFGFATKGKGFHHVVEAVNKEFDKAIVRINIPYGDFVPDSENYARFLSETCKKVAKSGIEVVVTHDFMSKNELVKWCASNTLNCFLYDRNLPGLSATTDQAIISKRPLSVSDNDTFRHIISYMPPYPKLSLKESINTTQSIVEKMALDWMPKNFSEKFEKLIYNEFKIQTNVPQNDISYALPIKENSFSNNIGLMINKYKRKIKKINASKIRNLFKNEEII